MALGSSDSYALPPRPAGCVARQRHGCLEPASVDRAICTIIGSDPWHYPCTKAGRLAGSEPCPRLRSVMRNGDRIVGPRPLPAAPPLRTAATPAPPGPPPPPPRPCTPFCETRAPPPASE